VKQRRPCTKELSKRALVRERQEKKRLYLLKMDKNLDEFIKKINSFVMLEVEERQF